MALRADKTLREPHLTEMPSRRVAVLRTHGNPEKLSGDAMRPLWNAVNAVKHGRVATRGDDFQLEPIRARWPIDPGTSKEDWVGIWAIPLPDDVNALPIDDPEHHVEIDTWEYGKVAEILHEGSYGEEGRAVETLRRFIDDEGYEIAGPFEEEYLARPGAAVPKTFIRFRVKPR
ncbi:MAG: GyrI-like domain-containing protein [Actinomycetota bacterium]|jgi:effector-binding domain-containing protein|nr:GyrI-like domain-containing protein [Actinomycetota bacterium]